MSTTSRRVWSGEKSICAAVLGVVLPLHGAWAVDHVHTHKVQSGEEVRTIREGEQQGPRAALRRERASTRAESERILNRATEIYGSLLRGEHGTVPQSVLKSAQCVSIFPNVVTVALAVGGTHGDGVAFCKDAVGRWAGPVFMDVTGGSLGLQMGAKAADTVIFYTGDRAKRAIEEGRFTLSGELDAVAGKFEESFVPPAVGAVSYMRSEGAFIGASLTGMSVYTDQGTMKAFYGVKAPRERVFELSSPESAAPRVNALRELLPKAG